MRLTHLFALGLFLSVLGGFRLQAQNTGEYHHNNRCGHDLLQIWQAERDSNYWARKQVSRQLFIQMEQDYQRQPVFRIQSTLKIPVVVHIMHDSNDVYPNASNLSDAQIRSQLMVLNEDFRKILGSRGYNTHPAGADAEIEFCLATRDPQGNPTTGIVRQPYEKSNSHTFGNDLTMKSLSIWPTDRYLNIWVVKNMNGILGYAYLPEDMATDPIRPQIDGVVIGARFFGSIDKQPIGNSFYLDNTFNLGRTTTHEVGHFLNLLHTWGDGGCESDDNVFDTPNCSGQYFGCGTPPIQCGNERMIANYMDYSDDVCMNIYTTGQKSRMRTALSAYAFRASLYHPNNILLTGCTDSVVVPQPDSMYILAGNNQLARINHNLSTNLQVRIVNQLGIGYPYHTVRFRLIEQPGNGLSLDTTLVADLSGVASIPFRTSFLPGKYVVRATSLVNKGGEQDFEVNAISASVVFPNPFEDEVIIKLDLPEEEELDVQVFDPTGRQMIRKKERAQISFVLDMRAFPDGAYTVRVISSQLTDIFRIVKIKP